ncbi:hypothetical protein [Streptomyces sp. NPDC020362]|uniref:hypothetical protein n=1 Tax=unclassified Streptomyces TaxID=2593676 RepID=UPI000AA4873B
MINDWMSELGAAGAAALVGAASTDAWQAARDRFVGLLGRGDRGRSEVAAGRLDALRRTAQTPDSERELAAARRAWQVRLEDLLEEHPDAAAELRATIESLPAPRHTGSSYRQYGRAQDHGTVNMNQHGDQFIREARPHTPNG